MDKEKLSEISLSNLPVKVSEILLAVSALTILLSLPFLSSGVLDIWVLGKIFYALGAVFFVFDK